MDSEVLFIALFLISWIGLYLFLMFHNDFCKENDLGISGFFAYFIATGLPAAAIAAILFIILGSFIGAFTGDPSFIIVLLIILMPLWVYIYKGEIK